jgi:hypothetical protein
VGLGRWLRGQTEHVLLAVKGKPVVKLKDQRTWFEAPIGKHSEKPDALFHIVESLCPAAPAARLEMFARRARPGWTLHGNEAPKTVIAPERQIEWKKKMSTHTPFVGAGRGTGRWRIERERLIASNGKRVDRDQYRFRWIAGLLNGEPRSLGEWWPNAFDAQNEAEARAWEAFSLAQVSSKPKRTKGAA